MHEKDLYPAIEKFLTSNRNCLPEYVGTELALKRGEKNLRADVFGVANRDDKSVYLCEGKKGTKLRLFLNEPSNFWNAQIIANFLCQNIVNFDVPWHRGCLAFRRIIIHRMIPAFT
jgi:hypothetical protein